MYSQRKTGYTINIKIGGFNMKKILLLVLVCSILVSQPVNAGVYNPNGEIDFKGLYFGCCQVTQVDKSLVLFEDEAGNVFKWKKNVKHQFQKGEIVDILFNGEGTIRPQDDKIVCVTFTSNDKTYTSPIGL